MFETLRVVGGVALISSHSQPFPVARFPSPPVAACRCHFTQPYRSNFLLPFRSRFPYVHKQLLRVPVVDYVGWVGPWAKGVARQPPGILHKKNSDPGGLSHLRRRSCCCRPLAAAVVAIVCTVVVVAFDPGVLPPPRPPTPPRITKNLYRMSDFLC